MSLPVLPELKSLPNVLPTEEAVRIELEEGIPIFRASDKLQPRIEELLFRQQETPLAREEVEELDSYEGIDAYLSFVNRTVRNLVHD